MQFEMTVEFHCVEQPSVTTIMELCFDADPTYMAQEVQLTPADICLLKVNNRSTRTRCKICSKLTKTPIAKLEQDVKYVQ